MTIPRSCIFVGKVVHKRLRPKVHGFTYRVFALCLDVDRIGEQARGMRFFSHNRFNLISFHDRDHGRGDGVPVAQSVRDVLRDAGLESAGHHVRLLCYPRLLGFVFNPLSVFFCYRRDESLGAVVYEVSNTFSERTSYVIPVDGDDDAAIVSQQCAKSMYVSPFTARQASYGFHLRRPGHDVVIGVDLREEGLPVLKTHFSGEARPLDDATLLRLAVTHPLMTAKVVAAIHVEAARLWLKGVPLVTRHTSPAYSVAVAPSSKPRD